MNLHVLVMAQGRQQRLPAIRYSKQLLEVGGEPILGRTLRLVHSLPWDPDGRLEVDGRAWITVVGWPDLRPVCARHRATLVTLGDPGSCIVDGIAAHHHQHRWIPDHRVVVLLGDVVYSRAALTAILADRRPLMFAGTSNVSTSGGEIFAAAWDHHSKQAQDLIATCPCRFEARSGKPRRVPPGQGGHMRQLLWWAQKRAGIKPATKAETWCPELYLPIDDWTDDVDTPADVAHLGELAEYARREERADYLRRQEREVRQFARE